MSSKLSRNLELANLELKLAKDWEAIFLDTEFQARMFQLHRVLMVMGNQLPMSLLLAVMKELIIRENSCNNDSNAQTHSTSGEEHLVQEPAPLNNSSNEIHSGEAPEKQVMGNVQEAALRKEGSADIVQTTLNHALIRMAVTVYPFAPGDKSISWRQWKRKLKEYMEKYHAADELDAFWKCSHILASTYMAICGGDNPYVEPAEEERLWNRLWNRWCCLGRSQHEREEDDHIVDTIQSANKLKLNGIKFKAVDRPFRLDTIVFKHRTLFLPKLVMNDNTASLFRNLALYEQVKNGWPRFDMRCYLQLMDCLIDTPADVRLLVESGVPI